MATQTSSVHTKAVGRQIATARSRAGMTQQDLADELGYNRSYVANLEVGKMNPTIEQLAVVSKALKQELRVEVVEPVRQPVSLEV